MDTSNYVRCRDIMLCYPFEERRLLNRVKGQTQWSPPFLCQPKLDGVRMRAVWDPPELKLLSSEAKPITGCPHIELDLRILLADKKPIEFDGELYNHQLLLQDIVSRTSRTIELHDDYSSINYHIFDIVNQDDQITRLLTLATYKHEIESHKHLSVVPTFPAIDTNQVFTYFDTFIEHHYEGIVIREAFSPYVRRRTTQLMKFKPTKEDVYVIRGFSEELSNSGKPKNSLGAFLVSAPDEPTTFSIGSGFTAIQRADFWARRATLQGRSVRVRYQTTRKKGVPRHAVFAELL